MAEPTTTTGAKPLTEDEQKTLDELLARKAAAVAAAAEQTRKDQLAALSMADTLCKLVRNDKVSAAIEGVIKDPNVDFDTKQRVQRFKESIEYNIGGIATTISTLSTPVTQA